MKKQLLSLGVCLLATVPLYAKTLEIREFTISEKAAHNQVADQIALEQQDWFDKGLIVFDATVSLSIHQEGKFTYRDTKKVPYVQDYDKEGIPQKMGLEEVGVSVHGELKKVSDQSARDPGNLVSLHYKDISIQGNSVALRSNGVGFYSPNFHQLEIDTEVTLVPGVWLLLGGQKIQKKGDLVPAKFLAIKLVE